MSKLGFNPRARDGRERLYDSYNQQMQVSIHAPVMDAKNKAATAKRLSKVSIHAPVMDAKLSESAQEKAYKFQSTRP